MTTDYRAMCAELLEALEIQLDELRFNNRLCIRARALLDQPVAEGGDCPGCEGTPVASNSPCAVCGRAVLAKWSHPTPQPVAVGERLPGPEDCDEKGRCWWHRYTPTKEWHLQRVYIGRYNYWLPANALPTPEAT
jgi:hypothetical protein